MIWGLIETLEAKPTARALFLPSLLRHETNRAGIESQMFKIILYLSNINNQTFSLKFLLPKAIFSRRDCGRMCRQETREELYETVKSFE